MYPKVLGTSISEILLLRTCMDVSKKCDFRFSYKLTLGVLFSESARKMTQNGGRVVAIGSIFDMNVKGYVRNMEKMWTIELLMIGDPKLTWHFGRVFEYLKGMLAMSQSKFWKSCFSKIPHGEYVAGMSKRCFVFRL